MDALTPERLDGAGAPPSAPLDTPAEARTSPTPRDAETPRQTRARLNRMERWLREHAEALTDGGHGPALVRLRGFFELAFTTEHADYLADEIRDLHRRAAGNPDA